MGKLPCSLLLLRLGQNGIGLGSRKHTSCAAVRGGITDISGIPLENLIAHLYLVKVIQICLIEKYLSPLNLVGRGQITLLRMYLVREAIYEIQYIFKHIRVKVAFPCVPVHKGIRIIHHQIHHDLIPGYTVEKLCVRMGIRIGNQLIDGPSHLASHLRSLAHNGLQLEAVGNADQGSSQGIGIQYILQEIGTLQLIALLQITVQVLENPLCRQLLYVQAAEIHNVRTIA